MDPSGHEGLICSKKYGELKKKEAEGGTLSEKEKRQIYEYEQNQKKSNGAGSDSKTSYSKLFASRCGLSDFIIYDADVQLRNQLNEKYNDEVKRVWNIMKDYI